jgi:hypothetical protein
MRRTLLLFVSLLLLLPATASAKDLRKRIGVGFNNNFSSLTSISGKFGLPTPKATMNVQIQALVGFAILKGQDDRFFAGGRVLLPIIGEDNLNLYGSLGGGYVRFHDEAQAARIGAGLGVEFFFFGLENLGLSAEFGLNLDVGGGGVDLQTTSGSVATVGAHYYF